MCVILDRLKSAGYTISFELYNAANFGAPQIRERVVIIGKLNGSKVDYLSPTHSDNPADGLPSWVTLAEALDGVEQKEQHYIEFPEARLKYYRMLTEGQYWKNLPPEIQKEAMGKKLELGGGKTGFYRRLSFKNRPRPLLRIPRCRLPIYAILQKIGRLVLRSTVQFKDSLKNGKFVGLYLSSINRLGMLFQ